jgi:hypothetical protein
LTMAGCWKIVAGSWRALAGLLLAACCGAAIAQATVPAVIGSEAFSIPVPKNFVQVPASEQMLTMLGQQITPPGNRLLGYFVGAADLESFKRRREAEFDRYFLVQTPRGAEQGSLSGAQFAELRQIMRTQQAELFKRMESQMGELYRDMERNLSRETGTSIKLKVGDVAPLGVYEESERYLSFGMLSRVEAKAGEQAMARDVICVATVALARGKVILFYAYANRLGQQDVAWAREVSRLWIAEFLKINPT